MNQCVLKVKPAKFVTVRSSGKKVYLCCVGRQTRGTVVQISTRYRKNKIQMAFRFKYAQNSYSPAVEGNVLKLEETAWSNADLLSEQYWFERTDSGSGDHYILRSVMEPDLYVSLPENSKGVQRIILGLSKRNDESILVTDEEVQ